LQKEVLVFKEKSQGTTIQGVTKNTLKSLSIPLPPLEVQKEIVARIEREQELVNANKELIKIFESK
jgi:restriction endonuclease S subunit